MRFDVEAIERATLASVPPEAAEELPGWLLGLDPGTVGRAHSAAPLSHAAPDLALVEPIAARYRAHGLTPVLRLPRIDAFEPLFAQIRQMGYAVSKPTLVQVGEAEGLRAMAAPWQVDLATRPHDAWASVFLGEGFDPVDGAHRVRLLGRSADTLYATVYEAGRPIAVGAGCFAHGHVGVHGMRTMAGYRGRGLAGSILSAFGNAARDRGIAHAYLQVEEGNKNAISLYARAGFATAWAYEYWRLERSA